MSQQLPSRPNLDHLKKQAKDALRVFRRHEPRWRLVEAQRAIARGYGFPKWSDLKRHAEKVRREHQSMPQAALRELNRDADCIPQNSLQGTEPKPANNSVHPIAGTWIMSRVEPSQSDSLHPNDSIVVDFEMVGDDDIKLTQVATDTSGRQVAVAMTMCVDGQEHSVAFGEGLVLQARWTTGLALETALKKGAQTLATATYEVSADGRSLVVSTGTQLVAFKRI
jgi:hypothetical protein